MKTYLEAAHAVQSGVAMTMELDAKDGKTSDASPKHLRTGLNLVMTDLGSLSLLLIEKGIITRAEFDAAIVKGTNEEAGRYEAELSHRLGTKITLG